MIQVTIWRKTTIHTFEVHGHALFKPHGDDIVCAGVSTAAIMTTNMLETKSNITHHLSEGHLDVTIHHPNKDTELIMDVFLKAIKDLIADYPKHITLIEREEAHDA